MSDSSAPNLHALMAHGEWVRALARTLVGEGPGAEDLAQEAMVVALERPPRHGGNLRGWFAQVLRNLHRQGARRAQAGEEELPAEARAEAGLPTFEVVERAEAHHLVVEQVLALPEPYRATVLLRYFDDLSPREIAAKQGVPPATVTSRLTRAHARLREQLDRRHGGDGETWMTALLPVLTPSGPSVAAVTGVLLMNAWLKVGLVAGLLVLGYGVIRFVALDPVDADPEAAQQVAVREAGGEETTPLGAGPVTTAREEIPAEEEPVAVSPAPVPTLSGTVFTPSGEAAAGATVVLGSAARLKFLEDDEEPEKSLVWTETDAEGRYAFLDVRPGMTYITAGARERAPSESIALQLEDGVTYADQDLQLRVGGRIHGEVLRKDGSPARNRAVRFAQRAQKDEPTATGLMRNIVTDEQGRFDEAHLRPGVWGLLSMPTEEDLAELGGSREENMIQATIELADRGEEYVQLGATPAEAVRLTGVLTTAGEPIEGMMQWIGECADPMGSQVVARSNAEGYYEVELPFPGAWYVRVIGPDVRYDEEYYVDVPEAPEFERNFALPSGSVSGLVLDQGGKPLQGVWLSHMVVEGAAYGGALSLAVDRAKTRPDGSFTLLGMAPGTYQIGATHREHGVAPVAVVTVGLDEAVEGLEFVMERGQPLSGQVIGLDELPVAGAPVWIRDRAGQVLAPLTATRSNKQGEFRTPPLPPGEYSLVAHAGVLVAEAKEVRHGTDPTEGLKLHLVQGADLVVDITAGEERLRGQVRVFDAEGRVYTGLRSATDPWSWQRYEFDSLRKRVGPFPAGRYRLSVHVPGRGTREQDVTLEAGESRAVHVGF